MHQQHHCTTSPNPTKCSFFFHKFFLNTAHGYIYITNIHVFLLVGFLSSPKQGEKWKKDVMKYKKQGFVEEMKKEKLKMEKRMQLLHKCSFLHYSHNRASYRQKLEKAQLVVTCKITQSLHCTLLLFFFTRSSKHAASSSRKRCFQGQPMR